MKAAMEALSKNAFFKNADCVARLFFEAIFERASQKENQQVHKVQPPHCSLAAGAACAA